jgi:hypothetical protein
MRPKPAWYAFLNSYQGEVIFKTANRPCDFG